MAPASRAALCPPAVSSAVVAAQQEIGVRFPDDLVRLFGLHDGADNTEAGSFLPSGTRLLSVQEATRLTRRLCGSIDSDEVVGVWWHPQWITFSANHDEASCYFVDACPGPGYGAVGYFFRENGGQCGKWPSLTAFAEDLANAIEEVTRMHGEAPRIKDDALSWE